MYLMNQKITLTKIMPHLVALSSLILVTGCVITPPGPSVASFGAGSDAAYINATRGRADAQITQAQSRQYALQQEVIAREMALEQQKRNRELSNSEGIFRSLLN
jgi:hypothetical protein